TMGADCLADIPHPEFPIEGHEARIGKRTHNERLINAFSAHKNNVARQPIEIECVKSGVIESKEYLPGRITIIGDFHKKAFIYREQFKPQHQRNIVFLNDIYSERDVRFKDLQRQNDKYLNFYLYPKWMRLAIREHIMQKVSHG